MRTIFGPEYIQIDQYCKMLLGLGGVVGISIQEVKERDKQLKKLDACRKDMELLRGRLPAPGIEEQLKEGTGLVPILNVI